MKRSRFNISFLAVAAVIVLCGFFVNREVNASVRLPGVFGNDMILQRDVQTPVWGWANPGEKVVIEIAGQRKVAVADHEGKWQVELAPQPAGGPFELTVRGANTITCRNIFYGDVWLCFGQSNIVFPLAMADDGKVAAKTATYPRFRFLTVPDNAAAEPQSDLSLKWEACSPNTALDVSAISFFFGQYIHEKLQIPVGIIVAAQNSSTCESWIETDVLKSIPSLASLTEENRVNALPLTRRPSALFNGMISPICPFAIKGVLWYQGESNTSRAKQYRTLFPTLINSWRETWKQGNFPFLFVQLPNYMDTQDKPSSSSWAELREAQHRALEIKNTAEVVTIDCGEARDLHPKDKKTVGLRLGNAALANFYEIDVPASGPVYDSISFNGNEAVVTFTSTEGGLFPGKNRQCDGSELKGFAIAGNDRKFFWANATISGENKVVLSSPDVPQPVAVRYAWADNPVCNLINGAGLPASPFRTDNWSGATSRSGRGTP